MTENEIKALLFSIKCILKLLDPVPLGMPDSYWEERKKFLNKAVEFIDSELIKYVKEEEDGKN